jgi:hypothetical protein
MESVFGLSTITMYGMMENVVLPVCLGGRIFKHHHRMKNNKKKKTLLSEQLQKLIRKL